jgi:hypothetical protein
VFSDEGLLVVTCTEAELPKAEGFINYVKESLRELSVGDVFKGAKARFYSLLFTDNMTMR